MKTVIGIALLLYASLAWAYCTTHTIFTADGRVVMCQTCCYYGNCTTTCF